MERLIYCPSEDHYETAIELSKKNHLPILIGDNDRTHEMDFDRSKVSVLSIPEHVYLQYIPMIIIGHHQIVYYINEFLKDWDSLELYINDELIQPLYKESKRRKYVYIPLETTVYNGKITLDNEILEEFSFAVCTKER